MSASKSNKPLSAQAIKAMKIGDTLADIKEYRGLRITRTRSDHRWWYRYTDHETGKAKRLLIGYLSDISLAEVRLEFEKLKKQRKGGNVPVLSAQYQPEPEAPAASIDTSSPTVGDVIDIYLGEYITQRRQPKGAKETRRILERAALKDLLVRPIETLTRQQLVDVIRAEADAGKNAQAGKTLQEFTSAIEYAIGTHRLPDEFINIGELAKRSLKQAGVKLTANRRQRYLTDNEIRQFLAWLPGSGG